MNVRSVHGLVVLGTAFVSAHAQTVLLDPVRVTGTRSEIPVENVTFSTRVLSGETVRETPALTIDSALRAIPSFSLFRRSDSLTAHPTAQGVSLRGLGPSGASRSLVVLDGIPLNDPFGGWVAWSKVPREGLSRVEIVPGAGGTAWGNAALGGVIQLFTVSPLEEDVRGAAVAGDFGTRGGEITATQQVGPGHLQVGGRVFRTDGFLTMAEENRGPIDTPAGQRHQWFTARWHQELSPGVSASVSARWFREKRANGTPYQENDTEEFFASALVEARASPDFQWSAAAYGQDQSFASTFSAVNAARTSENPASDQYDVPAQAAGAAWTGEWGPAGGAKTVAGADVRHVRGESRERYTFSNGVFTRRRAAGGRQLTGGGFVLHERALTEDLRAMAGSRLDYWRESGGFRFEEEIATGDSLRNERFQTRDGVEWSPSLGLTWRLAEKLRWRFSGQHSFRRPTLNELHRPFRVGNVITEANPRLDTETVTTLETAVAWIAGPFTGEAVVFWNELQDAVGNVTVARGPGNVPGFGFIPAGGLGRLRQNIERARVRGLELTGTWTLRPTLSLTGALLLNDAEVTRSGQVPELVGKRLPQVPKTSAALGLSWDAPHGWRVSPRLRYLGSQFEDDENELRLAPALVVDVGISRSVSDQVELFALLENALDERIETGRSGAGLINVGTPRFLSGGVRVNL